MPITSIGSLLLILATSPAQTTPSASPHLRRVIGLAAENGSLALNGNALSVYSTSSIRFQDPVSRRWNPASKKSGAMSIKISHLQWEELAKPLPISTAQGFALCDPMNQIDVGATNSRAQTALPDGAKIKSIAQVSDDLVLAVYSTSSNAVRYDIRVALLQSRGPDEYARLADDMVTDGGHYCGLQLGTGGVFLVLADEPSGSSDFSAVYIYALASRSRGQ